MLCFWSSTPSTAATCGWTNTGTQATRVESFANGLCFSKQALKPGEISPDRDRGEGAGLVRPPPVGLTAHDRPAWTPVPRVLPARHDGRWATAGSSPSPATTTRSRTRTRGGGARGGGGGGGGAAEGEGGGGWAGGVPGRGGEEEAAALARVAALTRQLGGQQRTQELLRHILDACTSSQRPAPHSPGRSRIGVLYVPRGGGRADMHIVINGEDMGASAKGLPADRPLYAVVDVFAATKTVRIVQVEYGFSSLQTLCRKTIQKHIVHRMALDWLELPEALKHYCKYE
ncbi:unnamed protein product [Gadus morhua 'NCC']